MLGMFIHHDAMFLRVPGRLCCKLKRGPLMALLSTGSTAYFSSLFNFRRFGCSHTVGLLKP
jgi:hypothetical protein